MKYMGSKSRIAKYIVPIIQKCIDDSHSDTYIEPFVGGANIIDKIKCWRRIGYDENQYLIALLKHIQADGKLLDGVTRGLYNNIRKEYRNGTCKASDWLIANVGFLASYNGRWFDGGYAQSGYEKTKTGERYRDYYQESKRNLEAQAKDLKDIYFECRDYRTLSYDKGYNLVIYCDPPYANTKQFANSQNFDYDEFWETMRQWSKNNYVLVSELAVPDDFVCIWEKPVSRSIKATDKGEAVEKLFTYKGGLYERSLNE
jgi:DNA adenine methylase